MERLLLIDITLILVKLEMKKYNFLVSFENIFNQCVTNIKILDILILDI